MRTGFFVVFPDVSQVLIRTVPDVYGAFHKNLLNNYHKLSCYYLVEEN